MSIRVRWLQAGTKIIAGRAVTRARGDEDFLPKRTARGYIASGLVVEITDEPEIPAVVMTEEERDVLDNFS